MPYAPEWGKARLNFLSFWHSLGMSANNIYNLDIKKQGLSPKNNQNYEKYHEKRGFTD